MILGLLGSILSGGATGLLGTAIQRYADHQNKKLDLQLEQARFDHQIALLKAQSESQMDIEDSKAFAESYHLEPKKYSEGSYSEKQKWVMVCLDFARGIVRPGLTLYLCALTTIIYYKSAKLLAADFILPSMAYDLLSQIINTFLYIFTTCCLWYFGTRNKGKQK